MKVINLIKNGSVPAWLFLGSNVVWFYALIGINHLWGKRCDAVNSSWYKLSRKHIDICSDVINGTNNAWKKLLVDHYDLSDNEVDFILKHVEKQVKIMESDR